MTAVESKEEISDTDSGIIVHSGPDSPTSPVKDVNTHTRALKLKHQSLEDRLELCLLELRKLCIREAELTGKLSSDYPLMPDEKPPRVRRRIGAAFKLDEGLIYQDGEDSELQSLEASLALQRQIFEAARRLSLEENLSKPQKKSRLQQCKREERKCKDLQEAVFQHRIRNDSTSPCTPIPANSHKDLSMSDDSSLSDVVALDDDVDSPPALGFSGAEPLLLSPGPFPSPQDSPCPAGVEPERAPIQNSPWKESSLDQPYQKPPKPHSASSSRSSSPVGAPVFPETRILPSQFIKSLAMRHNHSCSAPSTPELHARRQYSQSFRLPKNKQSSDMQGLGSETSRGRARLPQRRCAADFVALASEFAQRRNYQSSSEDSSSEHSVSSYTSSPSKDRPTEIPKLCPPPYGFHFGAHGKGQINLNTPAAYKNANQHQASPGYGRAAAGEDPLSPQELDTVAYVTRVPHQRQWQEGTPMSPLSPSPRRLLKPPPPYSRLVRTPSLNEYPNHASRMMPREIVSEELKSWHQRNQLQRSQPGGGARQGSYGVTGPTSPHLPCYKQAAGNVILQRAADGTPVQWFVEEDAEIVSQV